MEKQEIQIKALSDQTRINIVKILLRHNLCVKEVARRLNLTEAAISQHLKILQSAGLLAGEKRGYYMHYSVERQELRSISVYFAELADIQTECCKKDGAESEHCKCKKS